MKSKRSSVLLLFFFAIIGCTDNATNAQSQPAANGPRVGGQCEGCEAMYENKTPFKDLSSELTMPGYTGKGPRLHVSGVVYKADGKTPAAGTILYFYHTDQGGIYPEGNETGWGKRHGYIRGWLKTNERGGYTIKTLKPGAYPNRGAAAHIHCIVKEDNVNEYYIGDFLFADDPLLSESDKSSTTIPGGNGVLKPQQKNGILYAERDIFLGKNVTNYPSR